MSRHTGFQDLDEDEFLGSPRPMSRRSTRRPRGIPAERMRMHICWGNYEGPHDHDIPLEKVIGIVLKARPSTILFEAANPRHEHEWMVWRDATCPTTRCSRRA